MNSGASSSRHFELCVVTVCPLQTLQQVGCTGKTKSGSIAAGDLHFDGAAWTGVAGQYITFDGIFGAFFDGYWRRYTKIDDLLLVMDLVGRVEIIINRVMPVESSSEQIVQMELSGEGDRFEIPVPMPASDETRLVLTVRLIDDSSIRSLSWATSSPPERFVSLNAVICTFNRERDVAATVGELVRSAIGLHRILVINQGTPDLASRIHKLTEDQNAVKLDVIDQSNLGGAGGFGRGMLESLSDGCSHILLMDDDIDLDADIVRRLIVVLSYLRCDQPVGGAMLDRITRTRLFSVGDVLSSRKPEIRNLVDRAADDITQAATSRYLALYHQPDFNGWWFFAFSTDHVRQFGLPMPMFIRGDDVEFGYRLSLNGLRTLAWPGLAVWHEPFHTKRHPWHYFYDRRNSLFLCEAHLRLNRRILIKALLVGFLNHLLRYDYDRARCVTLGLRAFNDGPESLKRWNGCDHLRLVKAFSSKEEYVENEGEIEFIPPSYLPSSFLFGSRLIKDLLISVSSRGEAKTVAAANWRPIVKNRPVSVKVYYEDSRSIAEYRHDRALARACTIEFFFELLRFAFRRWRPSSLAAFIHEDFWSSYTS